MRKELKFQTKVGVRVKAMWRAMSMDLIAPKILPNLGRDVEVLEGNGGPGTILHYTYAPGALPTTYQKEKIVELDEEMHRIGFLVIEGGRLDLGFLFYGSRYQLSAIKEAQEETLVDITIVYEMKTEETDSMPADLTRSTLANVQSFEAYLLSNMST